LPQPSLVPPCRDPFHDHDLTPALGFPAAVYAVGAARAYECGLKPRRCHQNGRREICRGSRRAGSGYRAEDRGRRRRRGRDAGPTGHLARFRACHLGYAEEKSEEGEVSRTPSVTIFVNGKEVAKLDGENTGLADPPVSVQIAEIDPSNAQPEVVVSFYTGGAHCCSDTSVVTSNKDGSAWQTVAVGEFDGGPLLATDVNGDGRYEFKTRDNAFLYAFACYACSQAPLQLISVENGEVKNITADALFKPAHAAYLKTMIAEVPDEEVNGFLAGYVGEKILLGEGKQV
jgi:hypothetical protein